jgi:genome maintenance exonuclease 1
MDEMHSNLKALFVLMQPELDKINNIVALETPLWSKILGLAGRVDCIAEYDGKLSIIDFKASTKEKRIQDIDNYFMQATAYALMFQERTGIVIDNFVILISCEDGLKQVFQDKPINYVKKLKQIIKKFKESNGNS